MQQLGTGIGWRPEIADAVERMAGAGTGSDAGVDWVEVVAENMCPGHLPESLTRLRQRGVTVVPHGVSLGLGGAERPDEGRLRALAERAEALGAPLVTEHIAFVRTGGSLTASPALEAGHLLPVPRTRDALDVLCQNVRIAQALLPVPLALENIAALISWPGEEMTEGQFLYELADRTGVRLLIDVANLHTNHVNRGEDPAEALDELPLEAIAYVHVAGGFERDGVWHDSHAHPVSQPVLDVLADLAARVAPPGVLLERDANFPQPSELEHELAAIRKTVRSAAGEVRVAGAKEARATVKAPGKADSEGQPEGPAGAAAALRSEAASRSASAAATGPAPTWRAAHADAPSHADAAHHATASVGHVTPNEAHPAAAGPTWAAPPEAPSTDPARQQLALAQTALLSALVAGTPVPTGFDRTRLGVQARALEAKRADVVAKVAPELPDILGESYRPSFLAYAHGHPMTGGYRRDALDFAEHLLLARRPEDTDVRRRLREWWLDRSGPAPRSQRPAARLARITHRLLLRR